MDYLKFILLVVIINSLKKIESQNTKNIYKINIWTFLVDIIPHPPSPGLRMVL